jgi:hypothetical protein
MLVLFSFSNRTNLAAGKRVAMKSLVSLTKRNTARITTGAITAPADENFGEAGAKAWRRITENGAQQASDIWAGVNSAAAAAAKGTWDGIKPVKKVLFSDVLYSPKREAFMRKWMPTDITYASFIGAMHLGCLLAPFTFTWSAFSCFLVMYFITGCLGITLSYHRQLSHKSFNTPKWVEYTLAYFGAMAVQGDPLEWASSHRYHHQVRVDFPNPDTGRLMPCMECSHASLTTTISAPENKTVCALYENRPTRDSILTLSWQNSPGCASTRRARGSRRFGMAASAGGEAVAWVTIPLGFP